MPCECLSVCCAVLCCAVVCRGLDLCHTVASRSGVFVSVSPDFISTLQISHQRIESTVNHLISDTANSLSATAGTSNKLRYVSRHTGLSQTLFFPTFKHTLLPISASTLSWEQGGNSPSLCLTKSTNMLPTTRPRSPCG